MNVFNLDFYRRRKELQVLEQKMSSLANQPNCSARELKKTFKEWLSINSSRQ